MQQEEKEIALPDFPNHSQPMPHRDPPPVHRHFARAMRDDSTRAENLLWQQLRNRQIGDAKFRRQVPIDGFIVDFVCFEARLIIEVDGGQHAESQSDPLRDAHFRVAGFRVLRFWNDEIEEALDFVVLRILDVLKSGNG